MTQTVGLSEEEFCLIRDFIHEKSGIYFKEEKRSFLEMKLYPRVMAHGLSSFKDYLRFVKFGTENVNELCKVMSSVTNNETYFFREFPQLDAFRSILLPELHKYKLSRNEKKVRILSAGCSTGEEVYTLAMLVFESGFFFAGWDVKIMGLDISEKVLETAKQGIYYERSFRVTDPKYVKKFFSLNSGTYQVRDNLKKITSFMEGNLTSPKTWEDMKELDIIFCRNVLIYFSSEKVKAAVNNFYESLREGGCLLLGHSENLIGMANEFEQRRLPETVVYSKRG